MIFNNNDVEDVHKANQRLSLRFSCRGVAELLLAARVQTGDKRLGVYVAFQQYTILAHAYVDQVASGPLIRNGHECIHTHGLGLGLYNESKRTREQVLNRIKSAV